MSKQIEPRRGVGLVSLCAVASMLLGSACASEPGSPPDIALSDQELTQGTTQDGLWQSTTVEYCFQRPLLSEMPSSVRSLVRTQADLDTRFERRKQEFVHAIDSTWQAVGVLDLRARPSCGPGMVVIRYDKDTPTGGNAGIGRGGGLSYGIQMDSEFLGETYRWGSNTYHAFIAVHEFGHTLGFRHEQDRADSTCHTSQDFRGTGIALTGYDASSVMNYCNSQAVALTQLDKEGFRRAYAFLGSGGSHDDDTCQDHNQWCGYWADNGECTKNPGYMLTNCCESCGGEEDTCGDDDRSCGYWAEHGECGKNPGYMLEHCCDSCSAAGSRIVSRASGRCMDVAGRGIADGANIQQFACNATGAQAFIVRDAGGGTVNLVDVNSRKCVDVDRGATADGTNIQLWTCNGGDAQRFTRRDAGSGYVSLVNVRSGKCVDVTGGSRADGADIIQWTCHGGTNQQWRIE